MTHQRSILSLRVAEILVISALLLCLAVRGASAVDLENPTTSRKTHERGADVDRYRTYSSGNPLDAPLPGEKADITVHQVYAMYFGTLCDNDGYVVLDHNDTIVEDPSLLVYGGATFSAEISITGDAFRSVRIGCTSLGAPGMTLTNFTSNYGVLPLTGLTFDGTGTMTLHLGAQLSLSPAAAPGPGQTIGYTITATYE